MNGSGQQSDTAEIARLLCEAGILEKPEEKPFPSPAPRASAPNQEPVKRVGEILTEPASLKSVRQLLLMDLFKMKYVPLLSDRSPLPPDPAVRVYPDEIASILKTFQPDVAHLCRLLIDSGLMKLKQLESALEKAEAEDLNVYDLLVADKLITPETVRESLLDHASAFVRDSRIALSGDILVTGGVLTEEAWSRALEKHNETQTPLSRVLQELGILSQETLWNALENRLRVPEAKLPPPDWLREIAAMFPPAFMRRQLFLPVSIQDGRMEICIGDPLNPALAAAVALLTGKTVAIRRAAREDVQTRLDKLFPVAAPRVPAATGKNALELHIELDGGRREFLPGDTVSGHVQIRSTKPLRINGTAWLVLFWQTIGQVRYEGAAEQLQLLPDSPSQIELTRRFSLRLPMMPWSCQSKYWRLEWVLGLYVPVGWQHVEALEIPLVMHPELAPYALAGSTEASPMEPRPQVSVAEDGAGPKAVPEPSPPFQPTTQPGSEVSAGEAKHEFDYNSWRSRWLGSLPSLLIMWISFTGFISFSILALFVATKAYPGFSRNEIAMIVTWIGIASGLLSLPVVYRLLVVQLLDSRKRLLRRQTITVTDGGILFCEKEKNLYIPWQDVTETYVSRRHGQRKVAGRTGSFDYGVGLHKHAVSRPFFSLEGASAVLELDRFIDKYAVNRRGGCWQRESQVAARKAGTRLYRWNEARRERFYPMRGSGAFVFPVVGTLALLIFCLAGGPGALAQQNKHPGSTLALWAIPGVLLAIMWVYYLVEGVRTDERGITYRRPLLTTSMRWEEIREYFLAGGRRSWLVLIGPEKRLEIPATVMFLTDLQEEITRRATAASTRKWEHRPWVVQEGR